MSVAQHMVIEHLAASEADLAEEAARQRALALAALDALHESKVEIARLRQQLDALRAELRRYTARAVSGRRAA
jgi:hypothetical protein